jgi:hypothetical protein
MNYGQFGTPGFTALAETVDSELFWGGDASRIFVLTKPGVVSSATVDAGATPTWQIRKGMLLGKITASDQHAQWNPLATDGSQELDGVLQFELITQDGMGAAKRNAVPIVVVAPLKASSLIVLGSALVGSIHEYTARRRLHQMGCVLDDDVNGYRAGIVPRLQTRITDYTVLATDNGTTFVADTANVTFTLPAIRAGLNYEFLRYSDHNMVITSAEGDNIIIGNDSAADSITYSTAGNKVGARVRITSAYVGATPTLRWLAEVVATPFSTGAFLTQTLAT